MARIGDMEVGLRVVRSETLRTVVKLIAIAPVDGLVYLLEYGLPALATLYGALWLLRGFGVI